MESKPQQIDSLVTAGARRLLARAQDNRTLSTEVLAPRISAALQKYLLRDVPSATSTEIDAFIDGMQADDLCLILACEHGNDKAWSDLVERFTPTVRSAARSASSNEDSAEDLTQSIWAELYGLRTGTDGKPSSKLSYYSGRGSLAGWLRAVVGQLAIDTYRKQSRLVQTEEDTDLERLATNLPALSEGQSTMVAGLQNPERVITNRLVGLDLQEALTMAIKALDAEDRLLVKLYYFDELRLREAGRVLGVHEATASRRLTRIHADLKKHVTKILIEERGWTKAEADRAFAEVAQHLDADLEALVTEKGVS